MDPEQTRLNARIEDRHWWFAARRRIVGELVRELVPPSKDSLVVDIGCGTGGNTGALAAEYRCVGVDSSPHAVELARARFPQATFLCGDVESTAGPMLGEARVVLMMDVLEHVRDDFELFSMVAAKVVPGTYFVLTVPAGVDLWGRHDIVSSHYRRYDVQRFEKVWNGLPITCLLSSPYNSRLYPLVKLARSVNSRLGRTSGECGSDMRVPIGMVNNALLKVFGGESVVLRAALTERRARAFEFGVSLIAVLRRDEGEIRVRTKPAGLAPDLHDPAATGTTASARRSSG
jgi:SAM-dependent methyltransferase